MAAPAFKDDLVTRREAIRRVSALLGGAALIGQSAWLAGCSEGFSASPTFRMPSGVRVGFVREVRMMEPPSKWIRDVSLIWRSTTCCVSPCTSHLKPS